MNTPSPIIEPARSLPSGCWAKRYDLVDGFRGLAAIMVVAFHAGYLSWGHFGVTLFFVISGYCILASADTCQKQPHGARVFAVKRFHRIYPPYFCALIFFILTRLLKIWFTHDNQLAQFSPVQYLQNFTLTQWLTGCLHPNPNGINPSLMVTAYKSLNYEVQFYVVVGILLWLALRQHRVSLNQLILWLTGASFVWVLSVQGMSHGVFLEFWPVFGLGCLVFMRLCKFQTRRARLAVDGFLASLLVVCVLAGCRSTQVWIFGRFTEPLMIGAGFSLLLIALRGGSEWISQTGLGRLLAFTGIVSYSLFLIHQFNLNLVRSVAAHLLPRFLPSWMTGTGIVLIHVALATLFWYYCERPFLNERVSLAALFRKPASQPVA